MDKKALYKNVLAWFEKNRPDAESELHFRNPYELLVSVILSAQCTDKRVNQVTPALFARFPDALEMSRSDPEEIFSYIKSVSYPNSKAAHLHAMAVMLQEEFGGKVPSTVPELMRLPGVGRKTANVVVSVAFNQPAMAVDTHVFRVSARIGLTNRAKTPLEAERQLVSHIPGKWLGRAHHWLILHGRYVCTARNPKCEECGLRAWCAFHAARESGASTGQGPASGKSPKKASGKAEPVALKPAAAKKEGKTGAAEQKTRGRRSKSR